MAAHRLSPQERHLLVEIARSSVRAGLSGERGPLLLDELPAALRDPGATFVTLRRHEELLGCIGTMEPIRELAVDVHHNAAAAAFADPRLPAVTWADYEELTVKISVLGPIEPLDVRSLAELSSTVRPGVDGLLVTAGARRATFLPSVWEQVPAVEAFLRMLWEKAGLVPGTWSSRTTVARYSTVEFGT